MELMEWRNGMGTIIVEIIGIDTRDEYRYCGAYGMEKRDGYNYCGNYWDGHT